MAVVALVLFATLPAASASADNSHALIQGSGSSWSSNALNQWIADVQPNGIQVVFTASGSAQGRKDFGYRTNDFAITEIGFQGTDELTGDSDTSQGRAYSYLPIVAGGTSFPYQIRVGGQLVRDLRLSGLTLTKIFTNQITDWSDPAITADNNGRQLPSLQIIPVVHSEGSGTTAHFTDYLDKEYPDLWRAFNGRAGLTEYYPREGRTIAQSGSEGVMNFVTSSAANGAIGYDEYSYPLGKNYPVAKIQNAAGYYTLPTQYNVAVALTQANINRDVNSPDYLLQDLTNVYTYDDPRTYTLSSYSYMVIPTGANDSKMTTAKRQTIADFLYYSICDGQREVGPIGYSPLPVNLVQAGFEQVARLHDADPAVDLTQRDVSTCNNPTFDPADLNRNRLAEIAPQPPACDQQGQPLCDPNAPAQVPTVNTAASATTVAVATSATPPAAAGNAGGGASSTGSNNGGSSTATTAVGATATTASVTTEPTVATAGTAPSVSVQESVPSGAGSGTPIAASAGLGDTGVRVVNAPPDQATDRAITDAPGDLPLRVEPSNSNGVVVVVVVGLVAILVIAPAVRINMSIRRRRGVS